MVLGIQHSICLHLQRVTIPFKGVIIWKVQPDVTIRIPYWSPVKKSALAQQVNLRLLPDYVSNAYRCGYIVFNLVFPLEYLVLNFI